MDKGDAYTVADLSLADEGALRVDWARSRMPVLSALKAQAEIDKPLAGMRVAGCLHVTKETAVLIETIKAAGAEISWSGCNPLSTQDDVATMFPKETRQQVARAISDRELENIKQGEYDVPQGTVS